MAGLRLWPGAEAHLDGLLWQGFGVNNTLGVDGFPNGEAFRLGTDTPNVNLPRLFLRQTIGFGGDQGARYLRSFTAAMKSTAGDGETF